VERSSILWAERSRGSIDDGGFVRVADSISRFVPGAGDARDGVADIFSGVQTRVIDLMAGGAAEMIFLGDAPPKFMASDMLSANAIAGIVCRTPASIAAFVEHCYQEALALIERNKPVVLALARALINHPERTLSSAEIDQVIMQALAAEAVPVERARRAAWKLVEKNAADFNAHGTRHANGNLNSMVHLGKGRVPSKSN
jgi:hypothetical protein